jgi:hypothetical protein
VPAAPEAQFDPIVDQAFGLHALADAHFCEQVNRSLLQHTGANAFLHILTAATLDNDGVNPLQIQEVREHETGGSRTNNPDLGSQ